ncbi:hypothetical protein PO883_22155 [Massilia sp. DJPM01]|uniref:hypothetical protein n=1 Tax=Massilia sp. DJPM01 TaxID=3024404 RepID=UPI00259D4692|nr:hypothetical protein [Massilia sp. DJPM01]MDM5179899.1 hypothetical protein [Massilia sp. DJPM01]
MDSRTTEANCVNIEGSCRSADLRRFAASGPVGKLSLTKMPLLTERIARGFRSFQSVDQLWLWCDITRTAMRHVVSIPGLRVLDVLRMVKPGRLEGFSAASALEEFRANHSLSADDIMEVCRCPSLRELGAQGAELSAQAISALLQLPKLASLDLEGSRFDDAMAAQLSASTSITSLSIAATDISSVGLAHLCRMKQLRQLDLWATSIPESDLVLLAGLPELEYVSVGGYDHLPSMQAASLLPLLSAIPSLKQLWLDGVDLTPSQRDQLAARYEYLRIT